MNTYKAEDEISLRLLDELAGEPTVTQRDLSDRLGIALGLVNAYVKRLYKKGYVKAKTLPRNRIKYIITPKGLTEKARLTYGYMHHSIDYLREVRRKIEYTYALMAASGIEDILLWGDGEVAELCYISTRGLSLKVIGVVDGKRTKNGFFGCDIYEAEDVKDLKYDAILIAELKNNTADNKGAVLNLPGINPDRIYTL